MARSIITYTGLASPGTVTGITGIKAGDVLLHALHPSGADQVSFFAAFCVADGELIQITGAANAYIALIERSTQF